MIVDFLDLSDVCGFLDSSINQATLSQPHNDLSVLHEYHIISFYLA